MQKPRREGLTDLNAIGSISRGGYFRICQQMLSQSKVSLGSNDSVGCEKVGDGYNVVVVVVLVLVGDGGWGISWRPILYEYKHMFVHTII